MNAETLAALDASIEKWDRVAQSGNADTIISSVACPLCDMFARGGGCGGCPVQDATWESDCKNSPWEDAWAARNALKFRDGTVGAFRAAAAAEALFLRAIRPIGGVE